MIINRHHDPLEKGRSFQYFWVQFQAIFMRKRRMTGQREFLINFLDNSGEISIKNALYNSVILKNWSKSSENFEKFIVFKPRGNLTSQEIKKSTKISFSGTVTSPNSNRNEEIKKFLYKRKSLTSFNFYLFGCPIIKALWPKKSIVD